MPTKPLAAAMAMSIQRGQRRGNDGEENGMTYHPTSFHVPLESPSVNVDLHDDLEMPL